MPGGDRRAERAGGARRVKAAGLVGVPGGAADADHDLVAGDKGGDQCPAVFAPFLGDGERRRQYRGAGMRAGARSGQAVELEGMRQRAIGECRRRRLHRLPVAAEDMAGAAGAGALGVGDDDPAPRQRRAADDRRHRVDDAFLRYAARCRPADPRSAAPRRIARVRTVSLAMLRLPYDDVLTNPVFRSLLVPWFRGARVEFCRRPPGLHIIPRIAYITHSPPARWPHWSPVAQLVEQAAVNRLVAGSSPARGANEIGG